MIQFSLEPVNHDKANRPWYDTTAGITFALASLDGFNHLVAERHNAGYERGERLNQFYVLNGRYHLDICGNCGTVSTTPKDISTIKMPLIVKEEEFSNILHETLGDIHVCISMDGGNLPATRLVCPHCNKGWSINNCFDAICYRNTETIPLNDFVGMTLREVCLLHSMKPEAVYGMQPDILIRNDAFIDKSLKYPGTNESWQKDMVINEHGWVDEKFLNAQCGNADLYIIKNGDEGFFNVWTYFHKECNRAHLAETEEFKFKEIFKKSGFKDIKMTAIPNKYHQCSTCAPWFDVETEFETICIGWRKRVISINWNNSSIGNMLHLFEDENVTKGETGIHAWGWDKAKEYLSRIHKDLTSE